MHQSKPKVGSASICNILFKGNIILGDKLGVHQFSRHLVVVEAGREKEYHLHQFTMVSACASKLVQLVLSRSDSLKIICMTHTVSVETIKFNTLMP